MATLNRAVGASRCTCSRIWRSVHAQNQSKHAYEYSLNPRLWPTQRSSTTRPTQRSYTTKGRNKSKSRTSATAGKTSNKPTTQTTQKTSNRSNSQTQARSASGTKTAKGSTKGKKHVGSSAQWLKRQLSDPWAKLAADTHYASRSAFKLQQIDDKHKFLRPGRTVIDCGARPGGWSQVSVERCCHPPKNSSSKSFVPGTVVSVDICEMNVVPGASLVIGDFTKPDTQAEVTKILGGKRADVVLSDMAPPASGQPSVDFDRLMNLCDAVLDFTKGNLKPGGTLVVKLLGGGDIKEFRQSLNQNFESVKFAKPAASRSSSSESFVVASGFAERTPPESPSEAGEITAK